MAGILTRFRDIMASNFNVLLDRAEDPEKMITQYLRNLESDLGNVKAETAAVMADEANAKRKLNECTVDIAKMEEYAKKAVQAGNDDEARTFLEKRSTLSSQAANLQAACDAATVNADKMKEMHDKLDKDIKSLQERRDAINAKLAVAKTQNKLNKISSGMESAGSDIAAFDRMEEKANRMLEESNALERLNEESKKDTVEDLTSKYDASEEASNIDDELAKLKAELGK